MNHRERVLAALAREWPDRCPMQVSFTPEFAARLRADLGLAERDLHNPHGGGNTYVLERAIGQDLLLTSVGWADSYYAESTYAAPGAEAYVDEWGVGWTVSRYETPFGTGRYTEIVGHPLAEDAAIETYRPPDPERPELYADAERVVRELGGDYFVVGVTVTTVFETAWALRGLERLLVDLLERPELAERILDLPLHYHLAAAKRLAGLGVDMIWAGDDLGTQQRMLIAPRTWRRFLKPRLARFIAEVKAVRPGLKVAYHSDGNVEPIIPDLIDIGVDVLNPLQPRAMDPVRLRREYGRHLCFWGSIDEQHTLPFGSPDDVRREVLDRLRTWGPEGGLILGPTHHVQLDTPMENCHAMVETIQGTPCSRL